jgi:hypothetical protein
MTSKTAKYSQVLPEPQGLLHIIIRSSSTDFFQRVDPGSDSTSSRNAKHVPHNAWPLEPQSLRESKSEWAARLLPHVFLLVIPLGFVGESNVEYDILHVSDRVHCRPWIRGPESRQRSRVRFRQQHHAGHGRHFDLMAYPFCSCARAYTQSPCFTPCSTRSKIWCMYPKYPIALKSR